MSQKINDIKRILHLTPMHVENAAHRDFFVHVHHTAYRAVIEKMFGWDEGLQDEFANNSFNEGGMHMVELDGEQGKEKIGVIGWEERDDYLWVKEVFLLPAYQGRGAGTYLLNHCIKMACDKGLDVRLRTLKENLRAKALYEKLGFVVTDQSDIHWHLRYVFKA